MWTFPVTSWLPDFINSFSWKTLSKAVFESLDILLTGWPGTTCLLTPSKNNRLLRHVFRLTKPFAGFAGCWFLLSKSCFSMCLTLFLPVFWQQELGLLTRVSSLNIGVMLATFLSFEMLEQHWQLLWNFPSYLKSVKTGDVGWKSFSASSVKTPECQSYLLLSKSCFLSFFVPDNQLLFPSTSITWMDKNSCYEISVMILFAFSMSLFTILLSVLPPLKHNPL